jgi:medium-chain acyl-[acyl-carrier-protein] hydrolase
MESVKPGPELFWTEAFSVRVFETSAGGTLAVRSLCDFLQESAGNHIRALGVSVEDLLRRGMTWVLARLRVQIRRLPVNGEQITVRTWHSGIDRLLALRDFTVCDAQGQTISSAVSAWLIMDTRSRRPVRPQGIFNSPNAEGVPRAFAADLEKLAGCDEAASELSISVRWSDLDINQHVNNSRYAEWVVEGVSGDPPGVLAGLDLDFLAETQHPGTVVVRTRRDQRDRSRLTHAIVRAEDGAEVARARTEWRIE